jgi:tripartite-type tricarboxylate transporter receptor subunit TctC
MLKRLAAGMAALLIWYATPALADDVADFYKTRTISVIVGYGPGGGYDLYARIVSRFLSKFIPGNPRVIVQNMPGAGSLSAANYLYNEAPKDGTVIGTFAREMPLMAILGYNSSVKFNAKGFTWLGSISNSANDPSILYIRKDKLQSINEAMGPNGKQIIIGSTANGSAGNAWALLCRDVLGINLKIIPGYTDSSAIFLAVNRGEVDGRSLDYSAVRTSQALWLTPESPVRAFLQLGRPTRHPDFPDVPAAAEMATTARQRGLIEIADLSNTFARPFVAPPGLPSDRAEALQKGFVAMTKDPEFLAQAEKMKMEISMIDGREVLRRIDQLSNEPRDLLDEEKKMQTE